MSTIATMGMRSFLVLLAALCLSPSWAATNDPPNAANASPAAVSEPTATNQFEAARALVAAALSSPTNSLSDTNALKDIPLDVLDDAVKLRAGDVVRYRVQEDKEPVTRLVVTDGGEVNIPYLGHVKAEGKTCRALADEVKQLLEKDLYYRATVNVAIESVLRKTLGKVWVYGAVAQPGPQEIPVDEQWTVSKAVLRAGPTEFANRSRVKLKKGGALPPGTAPVLSKKDEYVYVDVDEVFKKGHAEKDVPVEPGDTIIVDSLFINFGR